MLANPKTIQVQEAKALPGSFLSYYDTGNKKRYEISSAFKMLNTFWRADAIYTELANTAALKMFSLKLLMAERNIIWRTVIMKTK